MKNVFIELISLLLLMGVLFFLFITYCKLFEYLIWMRKTSKLKYCKKDKSKKGNRHLIVRWINL